MTSIDIYIGDRYYGNIRIEIPKAPFVTTEEEIHDMITRRLPALRNKKFTISL